MSIPVTRYLRNKILGDKDSPLLYYLKPVPGFSRTITLEELAMDIEQIGSMSTDDIAHVASAIGKRLKQAVVRGDRVKIDGIGSFFLTFNNEGVEKEEDCTVRNIRKVNIRFKPEPGMRLVNDWGSATRSANNVRFHLKGVAGADLEGENIGGGGSGGGNWQDPDS